MAKGKLKCHYYSEKLLLSKRLISVTQLTWYSKIRHAVPIGRISPQYFSNTRSAVLVIVLPSVQFRTYQWAPYYEHLMPYSLRQLPQMKQLYHYPFSAAPQGLVVLFLFLQQLECMLRTIIKLQLLTNVLQHSDWNNLLLDCNSYVCWVTFSKDKTTC